MDRVASRTTVIAGFGFVITFVVGSLLLGELLGAIGDSDEFITDYLGQDKYLIKEMAGSVLLIGSALLLIWFFTIVIPTEPGASGADHALRAAHSIAVLGAGMILVAAGLLASVPVAKAYGRLFSDTALTGDAPALAPQVGVVMLFMPGAMSLAGTIGILTWSRSSTALASRGMRWFGTISAVLLALSIVTFSTMFLLPIWIAVVSIRFWRTGSRVSSTVDSSALG